MRRRLLQSLALVGFVFVLGTVGYVVIEGWGLLDSLYMTVITVATVGFAEVRELSPAGRGFTIVLILVGTGAILLSFGTFVDFLVEGHLRGVWEARLMTKRLADMKRHHIVAGFGRVGSEVASALSDRGEDCLIIDVDEDAIDQIRQHGWAFVHGDATDEETLRQAGIERARSLVTALDTDADNLFVTLTGRTLNPELFIVSRSSHARSEPKLVRAGADRVITPNIIGGRRMASMVMSPGVTDYLDLVSHGGGIEFRLEEVRVGESAPYAGMTLAQARVRDTIGVLVLGIIAADGTVNTNPSSESTMRPGDRLIVLGTEVQLDDMVRNVCDVK